MRIKWTYDVITEESASHGSTERNGWASFAFGQCEEYLNVADKFKPCPKECNTKFESVDEAVEAIKSALGYFEVSCSGLRSNNDLKHVWLSQTDSKQDMYNGEEINFSAHPSGTKAELLEFYTKLGVIKE